LNNLKLGGVGEGWGVWKDSPHYRPQVFQSPKRLQAWRFSPHYRPQVFQSPKRLQAWRFYLLKELNLHPFFIFIFRNENETFSIKSPKERKKRWAFYPAGLYVITTKNVPVTEDKKLRDIF
jgi:hypothetical protein